MGESVPVRGHGDRLSPIDASFLQLESAHAHMHVGWSAFLSAPDGRESPSIEALRERVTARLDWVPRCRQRLLPAVLGIDEPCWTDDPHFDIARHVVELNEPAGVMSPERFARVRDALLSTPLDRERPLWQLALVPRLSDGRMALIGRVHHALADGAAALQVAMLVIDVDDAPEGPTAPWYPAPPPNSLQRALDPLIHGAERAGRATRDVARACRHPHAAVRSAAREAGRIAAALTEDLLPRAPDSQLNGTLGPRRTLVQHRVPLEQLGAIARGRAGTRNDVGLAAVAGALRALAIECGVRAEPLKALVPVNMRRAGEQAKLGNRVSMTSIWLPLQLDSPRARLDDVQRQTARFKRSARSEGAQTVLSGLGLVPSPLRTTVLQAITPGRFNLTISSVAGPPRPLFMHGARLEEIYPVIPIVQQQALSIGMLAYDGQLHFGLLADADALSDVPRLAVLIDDELLALQADPEQALSAATAAGPTGTHAMPPGALSAAGREGDL